MCRGSLLAGGKAERRYAGVSHIDVGRVLEDEEYAHHVLDYSRSKGVKFPAHFIPIPMDDQSG